MNPRGCEALEDPSGHDPADHTRIRVARHGSPDEAVTLIDAFLARDATA
jgi:hypothetical protein